MDQFLNSKLIQYPPKTTRPNTPGRIVIIALTLMKYQLEVIEYLWENYEADDLPSWVGKLAENPTTEDEDDPTTMEEDSPTDEDTTPEEQEEVDDTVQELLCPAQSHGVGDVRQVVGGGGEKEKQVGEQSGEVVGGGVGEKVGDKVEPQPNAGGKPRIIPGEAPPKAKKKVPAP